VTDDESPVMRAVHAEAEAARDVIRSAGVCCPSCGLNAADLIGCGHRYETGDNPIAPISVDGIVKCTEGKPTRTADFGFAEWQGLINVAMVDEFCRRESEEFSRSPIGAALRRLAP
jgi:hypothetical protein